VSLCNVGVYYQKWLNFDDEVGGFSFTVGLTGNQVNVHLGGNCPLNPNPGVRDIVTYRWQMRANVLLNVWDDGIPPEEED
jgi:hypothetical protein